MSELDTENAPLSAEELAQLRAAWKRIGRWEVREEGDWYPCPLCDGAGEVEGIVYDAAEVHPATIGAYGIGVGLGDAELVARSTGRLLATVAELEGSINAALEEARTEREALEAQLVSAVALLRSAHVIADDYVVADRTVEETDWRAFRDRVRSFLKGMTP